jgi:hypothetical protein
MKKMRINKGQCGPSSGGRARSRNQTAFSNVPKGHFGGKK